MWPLTQHGYLSIVQKGYDKKGDTLTVRSRDHKSLETFCTVVGISPSRRIERFGNDATDYPYRVRGITRDQAKAYLSWEVDQIDYSNFKSRVTKTRGKAWHDAYMKFWSASQYLTPDKVWRAFSDEKNKRWSRERRPASSTSTHGWRGNPGHEWWSQSQLSDRADSIDKLEGKSMEGDPEANDLLDVIDDVLDQVGATSVHDLTDEQWRELQEETGGI